MHLELDLLGFVYLGVLCTKRSYPPFFYPLTYASLLPYIYPTHQDIDSSLKSLPSCNCQICAPYPSWSFVCHCSLCFLHEWHSFGWYQKGPCSLVAIIQHDLNQGQIVRTNFYWLFSGRPKDHNQVSILWIQTKYANHPFRSQQMVYWKSGFCCSVFEVRDTLGQRSSMSDIQKSNGRKILEKIDIAHVMSYYNDIATVFT